MRFPVIMVTTLALLGGAVTATAAGAAVTGTPGQASDEGFPSGVFLIKNAMSGWCAGTDLATKPGLKYPVDCAANKAQWRYLPDTGRLQTVASPSNHITYCATADISSYGNTVTLRPCGNGDDRRKQQWQFENGYIEIQGSTNLYAWSQAVVKPKRPPLLAPKGTTRQVKAEGQKWTLEPVSA